MAGIPKAFADGKVNQRHHLFVAEYLKDGNGTRAYRAAFPNTSVKAARTSAHRLLQRPELAALVNEARDKLVETAELDAAGINRHLHTIVKDPRSTKSEQMRALELIGKQQGLWQGNESRDTLVRYVLTDEPMTVEEWEGLALAQGDSGPLLDPQADAQATTVDGDLKGRLARLEARYTVTGAAIAATETESNRTQLAKHGPDTAAALLPDAGAAGTR